MKGIQLEGNLDSVGIEIADFSVTLSTLLIQPIISPTHLYLKVNFIKSQIGVSESELGLSHDRG